MPETENLIVSLRRGKDSGYVAISKNQAGEVKEENLHEGHLENVLNHFGKERWVLRQVNADETELSFSREKMPWIKRLFSSAIEYRIRNIIYEKNGRYEVGADAPFGETTLGGDIYFYSIGGAINYLSSKYGITLLFQSPDKKLGDETLIKLYFRFK